jgi:hypothetical protein
MNKAKLATMIMIEWKSPLTLTECHERLAEAAVMLKTLADYGPSHRRRFGVAKKFARDSLAVLTRPSDRNATAHGRGTPRTVKPVLASEL